MLSKIANLMVSNKKKIAPPKSPAFNILGNFDSRSFGMSLSTLPNGKIVVFGLPKSGNVWLVSLLADYLKVQAIDPYVNLNSSGVGMCHRPYTKEISNREDFLHGVYLIRDLRDVIVSYYYNTQREDWRRGFLHFHCDTIQQFYFEWFLPRVNIAHNIDNHPYAFTEAGLPLIRYEDLYDNPEYEFTRLIKRLGLFLDSKKIKRVVANNQLETLRKTGKILDVHVPIEHFRHGGHGGYKKELPQNVLDHINQRFSNILSDFGYKI